jgi:Trypsin
MGTVRTKARTTLALISVGVALIATAASAAAISSTNSSPAPERTEVGFLGVAVDIDGDGNIDVLDGYCSGTMIDSDTFLTAAHCTDNFPSGQRFFVSLEQDVLSVLIAGAGLPPDEFIELGLTNGWIVEGDMHRDPGFPGSPMFPNSSDQHDIAVIDFADRDTTPADLWTFTPATLPTAGQLDAIGARALDGYDWWAVGYGAQEAQRDPGGLTHPEAFVRLKAQLDFTALRTTWVQLAMNESRNLGGVCYGDSGGPNYVDLDGTLILAAVTSWGDIPCYAIAMQYRTDTPSAREFLTDFVELP